MESGDKENLVIGWIGAGDMGLPMAGHLIKQGYKLMVNSRTVSKLEPLIKLGAQHSTSEDIASKADILFIMLGYPHEVQHLMLGTIHVPGLLTLMQPGAYLIDHSTNKPEIARQLYEASLAHKVNVLDIPVSGGEMGAINGRLIGMVGGAAEDLAYVRPLLQTYCIDIKHMGSHGQGMSTKIANQIMIANNYLGLAEGLLYAYKAGLDLNQMIMLLQKGAASTFFLQY